MRTKTKNNGSVFLVIVFAIALLTTITVGILQMNIEELQLMQNQLYAVEALATAEAGLNDAFAQIRTDWNWTTGFSSKSFNGGTYTVDVNGTLPNRTITSTGISSRQFQARVEADVTISSTSPHIIKIDNLRINE